MKEIFPFLLLVFAASSCSLLEGLEGLDEDPPCDSFAQVDDRIRSAVPYADGQLLTFEASDGTQFTATVRETVFAPEQITGCEEAILFSFAGVNANNSLRVDVDLFTDDELRFRVSFAANGTREFSSDILLDADGRVIGNNPFRRIIPDTVLNGQTFRDVVAESYGYLNNPEVRTSYYNVDSGFIGVEVVDGSTVFLRE